MDVIISETTHLNQGTTNPPKQDGILRLYSMKLCPFAERARLVLLAKNLPHEIVNIDLKQKPDWFLELNPPGKVPVLDTGSEIVVDSLGVCEYLDETYPEPKLYPSDVEEKARDKELIQKFDQIMGMYYAILSTKDEKILAKHASSLLPILEIYENELAARGDYFGGNEPGMVDYMIWPWAERVNVIDFICGQKLPLPEDKIRRIRSWCNNMKKVNVIKKTKISSERHFNFFSQFLSGGPIGYDSI